MEKEATLSQASISRPPCSRRMPKSPMPIVESRSSNSQEAATPARQTTQIRTTDNAQLTAELKSRVLTLETRKADLLRKFTPTYPPVVEVEGQLVQAREALARTEQSPLTEEITDQIHASMAPERAGAGQNRALCRLGTRRCHHALGAAVSREGERTGWQSRHPAGLEADDEDRRG